jgi:hypothetical protein
MIDMGEEEATVRRWQTHVLQLSAALFCIILCLNYFSNPWMWMCVAVLLCSYIDNDLQPSAFPALTSCVMTMWVREAVDRIEINMTLNQCWTVLKCTLLMELSNHSCIGTALGSVKNRIFWTWNWQFHLKNKVSTKELSITDLFGEKWFVCRYYHQVFPYRPKWKT